MKEGSVSRLDPRKFSAIMADAPAPGVQFPQPLVNPPQVPQVPEVPQASQVAQVPQAPQAPQVPQAPKRRVGWRQLNNPFRLLSPTHKMNTR